MAIIYSEEFRNNTSVTSVLTDYPTLITEICLKASTKAEWFTTAATNGEDVQVYLDAAFTIRMKTELVSWDSVAETFEIHTLYSSLGTVLNKLYLVVDSAQVSQPAFTDTYGRSAVWFNYEGVWHLNDLVDSAGNYDLTASNAPTTTPGQIGDGYNFNGTTQYLENTSIVAPAGQPVSLQCWGASNSLSALQGAVSLLDSADGSGQFSLYFAGNISDHLVALERSAAGSTKFTNGGPAYTAGAWMAGTAVFAGTADRKMFVNGTAAGTETSSLTNPLSSFNTLRIGHSRTNNQYYFDGKIDEARWINSELSVDWIATEYANQSSPGTFWVGQGGAAVGSGIILTVNSAVSGHAADNVVLSQVHTLSISDAVHVHTAENVALSQGQSLSVSDATHGLISDEVSLSQLQNLSVDDGQHGHMAGAVTLFQGMILNVDGSLHPIQSDIVMLSHFQTLTINSAGQGHSADEVLLSQGQVLTIADISHVVTSDSPILAQQETLLISDGRHGITSDIVALSQFHALAVQNARHGLSSDVVNIWIPGTVIRWPDESALFVGTETRHLYVGRESRHLHVGDENRHLFV
ncbi:MAG: hypothetical protein COB49_00400 [Alphaproteobacteria bacterium]|nr:MAG: hypothetical protein COB49_00400 [Alphaproteobacteria bacterium]